MAKMPKTNIGLVAAYEGVMNSDEGLDITKACADITKKLNTCRLAKFTNNASCEEFYKSFFLNSIPDGLGEATTSDWGIIYIQLLSNTTFTTNLTLFMASWVPNATTNMFKPLRNLAVNEVKYAGKDVVKCAAANKAMFANLRVKLVSYGEIIKAQPAVGQETLKFINVISMTLDSIERELSRILEDEIAKIPDAIGVTAHVTTISEEAREFCETLEWAEKYLIEASQEIECYLNEAIVTDVSMKAKEATIKGKRLMKTAEDRIVRRWKEVKENRRNRTHEELIGEAIPISKHIRRLLKMAPLMFMPPLLGILLAPMVWIAVMVSDEKTTQRDRKILIRDIKDDIEIIDEKISHAERNGDDKAKVELMRYRQKLSREYAKANSKVFGGQAAIRKHNRG